MGLSELKAGQVAFVEHIQADHSSDGLVHRLEAMGILPNRPIQVLRVAWFGGPLHVRIGTTTEVAIRRHEAAQIRVKVC
ncbi:MAG: ferrous iron transport protein A [Limnoraphis sp. WC205]|jgi:ferrous iron transport protein A|nr:ferrous iron transport protein A [Limnoraphis sp. WC205]